jgi:hypothetical protein
MSLYPTDFSVGDILKCSVPRLVLLVLEVKRFSNLTYIISYDILEKKIDGLRAWNTSIDISNTWTLIRGGDGQESDTATEESA